MAESRREYERRIAINGIVKCLRAMSDADLAATFPQPDAPMSPEETEDWYMTYSAWCD